jgi:hypothetical protein
MKTSIFSILLLITFATKAQETVQWSQEAVYVGESTYHILLRASIQSNSVLYTTAGELSVRTKVSFNTEKNLKFVEGIEETDGKLICARLAIPASYPYKECYYKDQVTLLQVARIKDPSKGAIISGNIEYYLVKKKQIVGVKEVSFSITINPIL